MGQHLSNVNSHIVDWTNKDGSVFSSDSIVSGNGKENINLFLSIKTFADATTNNNQISNSEKLLTRQIQNYLLTLTKTNELTETNTKVNKLLMENGFIPVADRYQKAFQEMKVIFDKQQQLQKSFRKKLYNDNNQSIFSEACNESSTKESDAQQYSYFAIQMLTSLLLVSMKANERIDPSISSQIIILASQLCEQIPIKALWSIKQPSNSSSLMFKSLKPLINHINELSLSTDRILATQAVQILLKFSITQASFKDLLPIISKLIFNTTDIYNLRHLFIQMNDCLTEASKQCEQLEKASQSDSDRREDNKNDVDLSFISLNYLKSNGIFPNTKLTELHEKQFNGQFISSIILAHIDIFNEINLNKQFNDSTIHSSISFEFHPNTFKQLFDIIEQIAQNPNPTLNHILIVCIRLFKTHLKFFCAIKSKISKQLLANIDDESIKTDDNIDLTIFASDAELQKWFDLLLTLVCDNDKKSESITIRREASKALIYVLDLKSTSFTEKLSFMHKYIIENKYQILIEQLFIELNKTDTLYNWIDILCDIKCEKHETLTILYSFVDICLSQMNNNFNKEQNQQIKQLLESFQQFFLVRLVPQSRLKRLQSADTTDNNEINELETLNDVTSASIFAQYISHIFKNYINKMERTNTEFINQILVGLCFMTQTEIFSFDTVQPIFISVLPLLAEYLLQYTSNEDNNIYSLYWLIGKMSYVMIIGSRQNLLEMKYIDKLKSFLFSGGCERTAIENNTYLLNLYQSNLAAYTNYQQSNQNQQSSSDQEFLMSIYNNIDQGAQLISKIKIYVKNPQHIFKSIEDYVHDACAALFAVYIKHYRRINIAKFELSRTDNKRPHNKLVSLYEYATHIQKLFVTTKAQGGDCDELYKQIKMKTLFLLSTVKQSNLIPIIQDDTNTNIEVNVQPKTTFVLQRQRSQWTKAKHIFTVLRHTLHACIRFKKLMMNKRQIIQQNQDNESILHQQIQNFVCNHFHKKIISIENEESNEITQCMVEQYERAMTRLITYRFIHEFIQKTFKIQEKKQTLMILTVYLSYLRKSNVNWYYLEHIETTNDELKEEIRNNYYSIIKTVLSFILQSKILERNIFYLLNLSYKSEDIRLLYHHQLIQTLFKTYVSFIEEGEDRIDSLQTKLIGYNWFRFYVFKLCLNIQREELTQQQDFIFNTLLLNELKGLRQLKQTLHIDETDNIVDSVECRNHSLNNSSIGWFLYATTDKTSIFQIELCINQWLTLLLRCVHLYEYVRFVCGTIDFIEELLYIYRNSQNRATILLALKILRDLLPSLLETTNNISNSMINNLLNEFLFSIGDSYTSQSITSEIVTELIYIYRTIMSRKSSWQSMATQLVFHSITSSSNTIDWKSLETIDKKQWNYLLASLYILGGYIEPYNLGSIVNIHTDNECELGIIIDIDTNPDTLSYLVQYLQENKTEWIVIDKLEIKVDVHPTNLLTLPNANDSNLAIHSLLDTLGYIIQIDKSYSNSLRLLQLKRYCITTLYRILNQNPIIDIFMQKSYAPFIAQLSMTDTYGENGFQLTDLRLFNRTHLEQYCFSLDRWEQWKQKLVNNPNDANDRIATGIDNKFEVQLNQSNNGIIYNGWKPYASSAQIELYKKGRNGSDEISIVPFPSNVAELGVIQECGDKHLFKGRIHLDSHHIHERFPSFIFENLALSEGNWYYCVKLPSGGLVQIGWATTGFTPQTSEGRGIGDDEYSWSFDGSRGTLYNDREFHFLPRNIRWKANDVCGCGIEINGENTRIKYWLNGKFLGTAFAHQSNIASTTVKCNLLPNGPNTTFFPGVTVGSGWTSEACCELIISPEDMTECPLPDGYKPLLMPKLSRNTDSFVAYPYSAYLVGDDVQDFIYTPRNTPSTTFLRDFINENHIETELNIHDHQLRLTDKSCGFPFSMDNQTSSFTISFDFQILTKYENYDILLFTFQTIEQHSVRIPFDKINELTKTVILIDPQEREIKIYLNNNICQTINVAFDNQTMTKFNFHFLPNISVGIKNFAIWKYALSEEHIRRLFISGLSYVASDYKQKNKYRLEANTFTFTKNQQFFSNELLVPLDEQFSETKWIQTLKQIDMDESKFFQTLNETDESVLQFYGNKTYIVLKKSAREWHNYTIILDILIPNFPTDGERLTLVLLNLETFRQPPTISITSTGQICLNTIENTSKSEAILKLNQFIRLLISVHNRSIKIYADGSLVLDVNVDNNSLTLNLQRIHLFRELYSDDNTTNVDTLRIKCKSITFLNQSIRTIYFNEILKSPKYSLETLVAPPVLRNFSSLINIGYKPEWIKYVMKQYKTNNIQFIDTIIREHKEEILKADVQMQKNRYLNIFLRLGSSIDKIKLENLIDTSTMDTNDQLATTYELIRTHWNDLQTSESLTIGNEKCIHSVTDEFELNFYFAEWIHDKSTSMIENADNYQLFDLSKSEEEGTIEIFDQHKKVQTSNQYSHKDISYKQYIDSRIACEYGLTSIYARDIISNILTIWSNTSSHLFPLEKFGDYPSIVKLLRSINDHYTYTKIAFNDHVDPLSFLVKSILKNEIKSSIENIEILPNKISLLYHLQKDIIIESIRFLFKIELSIDKSDNKTTIIEEQTKNEEMNLNFIIKILNIFVELVDDKSTMKQQQIDKLISYLFPEPLINVMFDLFLILPTHQSKIFILHLFITLMQTSVNFCLNERIQKFLSQLLIELLSTEAAKNNRTIKTFQMIVIDFVYLNLSRQKSQFNISNSIDQQFEMKLSELPQNFQYLWMIVDIINAITDQTKETPYPDLLFIQACNMLDETLVFTLDDITISNCYFDNRSDLELINLMNNDALIEHSFSEFIHSLDIGYASFELYPLLLDIPADCIKNRAKLFHILETLVEKVLSLVDFSLALGKSILVDKIRIVKNYLLNRKRMSWFEQSLNETKTNRSSNYSQIQFDFLRASTNDNNGQNTTFNQGYEQLHENAHVLFRSDIQRLWQAQYVGMHSSDAGGPYRDSITSMCSDICTTRLPLFILCPNGRTNNGLNRDRWIPNVFPPNQSISGKIKKQYQFVGQLMGMAIRRKHYLDLKFPNLLWKQLVDEQITIKDIEDIDIQSFVIIKEMENNLEKIQSTENENDTNYLFNSIMSELRFDIVSSDGHTYEMIPGGKDIPITADNFKEYCTHYREYRLNEFRRQIEYIRQGLCSVVPNHFLTLLTASELEEAVCGKSRIDVELLKRNTRYSNSNLESPYIQRFWKVLSEMFNEEQKKLFLKFVWGRNTLPKSR